MFFNQYPYLNLNDLNLDYILKAIGEMKYEVTNFVSINAIKYADPIQWDITRQYEKNTIVIDPVTGTAYISVAPVPAGVALTRPEYWTVVFDLGSFVTRAAQNFTSRWESETTTTATFATATGEWLVWGDVLYKALSNIIAGDTYVVGSNIEHFTIEDLYNAYLNTIAQILAMIGDLDNLDTLDKTSLVAAINEAVDAISQTNANINRKLTDLYVVDYIYDTDNNDIGLAIQRCVDIAENGRTNSTRIILPQGRYTIKTPVFIDKKEGLIIQGSGRLNTILECDGTMLYTDNTGYPDSYAKNAFFIVALDRDFDSGLPTPVYGYSEYYLTFKDFSMIDPNTNKTISAIFGYGIASSLYENINCDGLKYFIEFDAATSQGLTTSVGAWSSRFVHVNVRNCIGFNKIDRGTSLNYINCAINDSVEGYHIQTQYTDLIACTCERWDKDNYAYDFDNCACVNAINCGSEQGHGGILHVHGNEAVVNFIGCFLTGVIDDNTSILPPRMNLITDKAIVVFENSALFLIKIVGGVQQIQTLQIAKFAHVTIVGMGRYSANIFRPVVGSIYDYVKTDVNARLYIPEFNGQITNAAWTANALSASGDKLTDNFTLVAGTYHIYVDYPVIDAGAGTIATSIGAVSGSYSKVSYSSVYSGGSYAQQHAIISCTQDVTLAIYAASGVARTFTNIQNAGVTIVRIK